MARPTLTLAGDSGNEYVFDIYPFDGDFRPWSAVYVVLRRYPKRGSDGYLHDVIYIGQTDDLPERFVNHHKADCFTGENASAIGILAQPDEQIRLAIERDLCRAFPMAPCQG